MPIRLFIGWDAAQMVPHRVAGQSARACTPTVDIRRVSILELRAKGLYTRPTIELDGFYRDVISDAPMSTGHAIARFLVPALVNYAGWAIFTDGDVLFRDDLAHLMALADERFALQVVQHSYEPTQDTKMTGQLQTRYARKNWSSVMLLNCGHPANRALTVELVNTVPGRDLHRFCWLLEDGLIGALPERWNHLVGHSAPDPDAAIVHFTEGTPDMPGYEHVPFSDEWYSCARVCGYRLTRPARPDGAAA